MSHGISPIFLLLMLPYFGLGDISLPETNRTLLEANRTTDYIERGIMWYHTAINGCTLYLGRVPVTQDNLLATLPSWGPTYRVTLSLYINSFDGDNLLRGKWAELLRFTSTDNNCCAMGDRVPAIFTNKGGFIQVASQLGDNGNRWRNVFLEEKTWYSLEILQFFQNNKVSNILHIIHIILRFFTLTHCFQYFLRLKLNQEVLVKMENTNPVIFNNVQVWAAKAAYNFPPADAYIRDLTYVNLGN